MHQDALTDKKADEVIIKITESADLFKIVEYIKENIADKQIVFYLTDFSVKLDSERWIDLISICNACLRDGINLKICLEMFPQNIAVGNFLLDGGIPFFYHSFCNTKMQLMRMFDLGVSDIYIGGELGFLLKDIQILKNKRNVNFRIVPDHPRKSDIETLIDPIKTFWILPESLDIYEPYIDVLELTSRVKTKLDIYKNRKWEGKVSTLIPDSECEVFANTIPPSFGFCRLNCGLHCAYSTCRACYGAIEFAQELTKRDLEIRKDEIEW